MGSLIKSENYSNVYYNIAMAKKEKGDLTDAISFLFNAYKTDKSYLILKEIALIYADMGLYGLSNKYLFKFLNFAPTDKLEIGYKNLAINGFLIDDFKLCAFYFDKYYSCSKTSEFDETEDEIKEYLTSFIDEKKEYKVVYPPCKADYSEKALKAKNLLVSGKVRNAIKEYLEIPKESKAFIDNAGDIAFAYLIKGDLKSAEDVSFLDLEKNGESVKTFCNLSAVNKLCKNHEKSLYYFDLAKNTEIKDEEDYYRLSTCALELNLHKDACKFLKQVVLDREYDVGIRIFYTEALINNGDYSEAYKVISKTLRMVPEDIIVKYYCDLSKKLVDNDVNLKSLLPLKYCDEFPLLEIKKRKEVIKELSLKIDAKNTNVFNNSYYRDTLTWGIKFDDREVNLECLEIIDYSSKKESIDFALSCLLDNSIEEWIKRTLISYLVIKGYKKKFGIVVNDIFGKAKPETVSFCSEKGSEKFLEAYAVLFSYHAIGVFKDLTPLKNAVENIYDYFKGTKEFENITFDEITLLSIVTSGINTLSLSDLKNVFKVSKSRYDYFYDYYVNRRKDD